MPDLLTAEQLSVISEYEDQLSTVRERVTNYIGRTWVSLDDYHDDAIAAWIKQVAPVANGGQAVTGTLTDRYLSVIGSELVDGTIRPVGVSPNLVTTEALRGVTDDDIYRRAAFEYWKAISTGADNITAAERGRIRAETIAAANLQLAKTHASRHVLSQNDRVVGYRRVLAGKACSLCGTAKSKYAKDELMPIHNGCRCGVVPIYRDAPDPGVLHKEDVTDERGKSRVVQHDELGPELVPRTAKKAVAAPRRAATPTPSVAATPTPGAVRTFPDKTAAQAWGKEVFGDWTKKVTPVERQALNAYTGSDYRIMNDALRGKKTPQLDYVNSVPRLKEELRGWNENLTRALHRGKTPEPMQVTRGGVFKGTDFKVGDTMRDEGFVSSTMSTFVPKGIKNDTIFTIDLPKDTKGAYVGGFTKMKAEAEFLMPPGAEFRITSVEQQGSKRLVRMELISQDTEAKAIKRAKTKP